LPFSSARVVAIVEPTRMAKAITATFLNCILIHSSDKAGLVKLRGVIARLYIPIIPRVLLAIGIPIVYVLYNTSYRILNLSRESISRHIQDIGCIKSRGNSQSV